MRAVKFCLLPIALLGLAVVAGAWFFGRDLPTEWSVEARRVIAAPPVRVHAAFDDLRRWPEWNDEHAPNETRTLEFGGEERGVGQVLTTRNGSNEVRIEITASDPTRGVWFDEVLAGGLAAKNAILLVADEGGTRVHWEARGSAGSGFFGRLTNAALQVTRADALAAHLDSLQEITEQEITEQEITEAEVAD